MGRHEAHRVSAIVPRTLVVLVVVLAAVFAPAATARIDLCGTTIVADVTLDQDLTCLAGGLIVGADGIMIDLHGHSITGAGVGNGIAVNGRTGVSIVGGSVVNFFAGVLLINSSDIAITGNSFVNNTDGIDVQAGSSDVTVKENVFSGNRSRGIMLRGGSTNPLVKENTFTGNRVGILLFAPTGAEVKENTITASILAGIRVNFQATSNLVVENTVTANPIGIDFIPGPSGGPAGNEFVENTIASNTCGLNGPLSANTFTENQFVRNTQDVCGS